MIIGAEWMTSSLRTQTNLRKQALEIQAAERSIFLAGECAYLPSTNTGILSAIRIPLAGQQMPVTAVARRGVGIAVAYPGLGWVSFACLRGRDFDVSGTCFGYSPGVRNETKWIV
jgi:hypothetical protein